MSSVVVGHVNLVPLIVCTSILQDVAAFSFMQERENIKKGFVPVTTLMFWVRL